MRRFKSSVFASLLVLVFVVLPSSCGPDEEDVCDQVRQECEDSGGTPQNCESTGSCILVQCQCECITQQ
jgi:hypothetical protein